MGYSSKYEECLAIQHSWYSIIPKIHLIFGLIIREILAPFTGHAYDFEILTRLGVYMQTLSNPYVDLPYYPRVSFSTQPLIGSISYPPLSAFLSALSYRIYLTLGSPSRFLYYFLLKQPIVISDILTAIVLVRLILISQAPSRARIGFTVWIYLPLSLIASSVWGALDSVALLLALLAAYYLLTSREVASACLLGLAIFVKTVPLVALPVLVMQIGTGLNKRLRFAIVSTAIPTIGSIAPTLLLGWGFKGIFDNLAFQADIPSVGHTLGEMSLLGQMLYTFGPGGTANLIVGALWIPALVIAYIYISRTGLSLLRGMLVTFLVFSVARSFLSEQWAIYPLALLLAIMSRDSIEHFVGISIVSTLYLILNNMLLVRFLAPILPSLGDWTLYGNSLFYQLILRELLLGLAALFFLEAIFTITQRDSILYRILRHASTQMLYPLTTRINTVLDNSRTRCSRIRLLHSQVFLGTRLRPGRKTNALK